MLKNLKEDYVKTYKTKADTGRSMLEILAVLAIIGILSIAAITGYTYAMSKHKANQIYKQVDLRAVESFSNPALVNYEPGAKYNLIGFEKELSNISYSQEKGFNKKFYVIVKKVPVRVCKMLQKMVLEDFPIEREVFLCQGDLNATECMGAVSECEEGENNTFVFAYDIGVRGTLNIPDPDPEPDPCPNGKMFGSFCCHNEFIEDEECCTNDNETWKTDSKTCCEAKYHHWVDKETMVETETDDANGMCCINSSEYVFTSKDSMCCNLNQNLNQAVNNFYCCPKNYETLSEESTIEKKIACCKAAGRNWAFINEENFKCCEKDTEPVIVDSDIVCCPADRKKVINGTCCPFTATGVVDGECCTITKVVQDTDTGEEETICCDNPSDPRCADEGENDLEDPVPTDEETCISEGGEWIQKENETPHCCTLTQIRNTQTCCEAAGYTWNGEKEEDKCTAETSCRIIGDLNTKETICWVSSMDPQCAGEDCSALNTNCRPSYGYDNGPFFSTGCEGGEVNSSAAPVCSKATHNNVLALSYQVPCPSGTFCNAKHEDRNYKKGATDTPKALYGTCQQIGGYVEEGKYIRSDIMLNWWSAGAWCLANGKKWASIGGDLCPNWAGGSVTDLGCYTRLTTGEGLTEDDACKKIADSKCSEFSAQINGWTSTASMEGVAYQVQGGGYIEENGKIEIISDSETLLGARSSGGRAICVK